MHAKIVAAFLLFVFAFCELTGCVSSARFARVPAGLDTMTVKRQSISINARRFSFDPEEIRVKKGTLLTMKVTALDTDHGFKLSEFGIDVRLPQGEPVTVQFFAAEVGTYEFVCSTFCGLGHPWMNGMIVVTE